MADQSTTRRGRAILADPLFNKGTSFSVAERRELGLLGLLPPHVETIEEQVQRAYEAFLAEPTPLEQHILLRRIQDTSEAVFYRLVVEHLHEMMPVIYTPTVGTACEQFSEIYRVPRGLFIAYPNKDRIDEILENTMNDDVRAIVVTDGQRILGLGDQGAGGMGIPIGKLSLYTAAGGIHPAQTLPVLLDCGTDNDERLADPFYIGWRNGRVDGDDYLGFVDAFVQAVKRRWPHVLLQFEDFAIQHAVPLLETYRDQLCMFNDDVQGTAAVAVGTLLAASRIAEMDVKDHRVVFLGAGSAGSGIAEHVIRALTRAGLSAEEARARVYMVDRYGLIHDRMEGLAPFQQALAQPHAAVAGWAGSDGQIDLASTVAQVRPTALVGVCGQPGLFTEEIVRSMASQCARPIIFPMSNPTSRAEAVPEDILRWTDGRALVATGSPFEPVDLDGTTYAIAQSNNTYIFPGIGLGVIAAKASRVTDGMLSASAEALAEASPVSTAPGASILPPIEDIRDVCKAVAIAVARQAQAEGVAPETTDEALLAAIDQTQWVPDFD
ncbi:MAG: NAD-dependent malic enzyme [Pseudomonadota bacterium]